jgi:hypothetical protein
MAEITSDFVIPNLRFINLSVLGVAHPVTRAKYKAMVTESLIAFFMPPSPNKKAGSPTLDGIPGQVCRHRNNFKFLSCLHDRPSVGFCNRFLGGEVGCGGIIRSPTSTGSSKKGFFFLEVINSRSVKRRE